jgi:hypothetical protein
MEKKLVSIAIISLGISLKSHQSVIAASSGAE